MKLRNKKTGEIMEFDAILSVKDVRGGGVAHLEYDSLAELNEEWEDYEEPPKMAWYIWNGGVQSASIDNDWAREKAIGNYFETKEEAEKAVEKIKAWRRLKDKGFSIYGWDYEFDMVDKPAQTIILRATAIDTSNADLDLLFGGEDA